LSGSELDTTNNRMELRAALEALLALPVPHRVELHTDSRYLQQGVGEWLPLWRARNWLTSGKKPVKNRDLWQALSRQIERHDVRWRWLRGHSGDRWNERADRLATAAIP
jgi:ribonuclease HI